MRQSPVALLLDTSGSTFFHLWEIKEAAIKFAKQLRPQDRVLVVTFDRLIMLLTEATNDPNVVTEVVERNAVTGFSTRLYDALDLVIKRVSTRSKAAKPSCFSPTALIRQATTRPIRALCMKLKNWMHSSTRFSMTQQISWTPKHEQLMPKLLGDFGKGAVYSIGYYPPTTLLNGERREIKVRVDQPDVAVRARDSYVRQAGENR